MIFLKLIGLLLFFIGQNETVTLSRTELARAKFAQARSSEDAKSVDYGMGMGAIMRKGSSQEIREGMKSKSSDNVSGKSTPTASRATNTGSLESKKTLNATSSLQNSPDDKLKSTPPQPPPKPNTQKPEPPPKMAKRSGTQSSKGASSGGTPKSSSKDANKTGKKYLHFPNDSFHYLLKIKSEFQLLHFGIYSKQLN